MRKMIFAVLLTIALVACGDDSGTSVNDGDGAPEQVRGDKEAAMTSSSRHSGPDPESSSSKTVAFSSVKAVSSSSVKKGSSSSVKAVVSSSSVKVVSSSSVAPASSSSKKVESSSSKKVESSSCVYVPFDHSNTLASDWYVGENAYKQFTDPRNGRSYYYLKIIGKDQVGDKDSVTIMAENLNIGKMILGTEDQKDDKEIERYCYSNDTTKCDEFGGLYQWAEMMQLPSRCNTESCADLIQENHRGICPEGWRLMKWKDFYIAWHAASNDHGIEGVRSSYGFNGYNSTGLSLTGAGLRTDDGKFEDLKGGAYWFLPKEFEGMKLTHAHSGFVASDGDYAPTPNDKDTKLRGSSVRCVKVE